VSKRNIRSLPPADLVPAGLTGDRRAIGRLLTLVERGGPDADAVASLTQQHTGDTHLIGITGAPGSGKSTLVSQLVAAIAESTADTSPAVLAVDPSSPLTGGAILGDRVRMAEVDTMAFIRSVATRGHAGGLALSIPGASRVLDAMGFSPVIIETVGVGQVEVDVTAAADTTVVVVTPGMGDAVQANKAGLLEVADVFVVNKADRPGASDARRDLELMLELSHVTGQERTDYRPPILMTNSLTGEGVAEVVAAIGIHRDFLASCGEGEVRRRRRIRFEIENRLALEFERAMQPMLETEAAEALMDDVTAGSLSVVAASAQLGEQLFGR